MYRQQQQQRQYKPQQHQQQQPRSNIQPQKHPKPQPQLQPQPQPQRPKLPLSQFALSQGPSNEILLTPRMTPLSPITFISLSYKYLACGSTKGIFSFFNIETQTPLFSSPLPSATGPITAVSPIIDNFCICGSSNGVINILNTTTNKLYNPYCENTNAITSIQFNNHYQTFISSSLDNTIKVFKIPNNRSVCTITEQHPVTTISWMNSLLVSGNQHGEINIYDVNTSSAIYSKKLFNTSSTSISNVSYIHIDNTNNNIITCTARTDNTLNVLDMRMNRLVCNNRLNCGNILHTCNESKYGYIIVYGSNKLGKVMNVNSGFKDQHQLETSTNVTCGDTDDGFICVGCEDGCILGYELTRFESVFGYRSEERGKVHQCKLDKDSMNIYTAGDDGNVKCLQCINNEI